jgi:thioredoxin 1
VSGKLADVTDTNFDSEVLQGDGPILVDFWAPWCGPCRVVHPVLEEIDAEREDLKIVSLNTDDNPQTAAKFEVLSIPTMILFRDGEIAKKIIGAMPKARLEAELEPALA